MSLRVSTTGLDVEIIDLGITIVHPTTDRDLTLEFTAIELKRSENLTSAIQNGDLDVDDGTHFIHQDDYDPDEVLIQELGYNRDELYISHDELASSRDILINKTGVFPLSLNSTASVTRNIYSPAARFITWQLQIGDIVTISGSTAADGTYTVESITDQQNFVVVEAIANSNGGTTSIYHPGGSARIGVIDDEFTTISGQNLQDVLDSIDYELATGGFSDELVKVTNNDTTAGYLKDKLTAGTGITLIEQNDGGNETLEISSTGGGSGLRDIHLQFNGRAQGESYSEIGVTSWTSVGLFTFRGSSALGTPTAIKAILQQVIMNNDGYIRVVDITNNQTIVTSAVFSNTSPEIVDLGTISNVPSGEAIWEIQIKNSKNQKIRIYSMLVEFG